MSGWDRLGKIFAGIAKGAAVVAVWASQHPEVIQAVVSVAQQAKADKKP